MITQFQVAIEEVYQEIEASLKSLDLHEKIIISSTETPKTGFDLNLTLLA